MGTLSAVFAGSPLPVKGAVTGPVPVAFGLLDPEAEADCASPVVWVLPEEWCVLRFTIAITATRATSAPNRISGLRARLGLGWSSR